MFEPKDDPSQPPLSDIQPPIPQEQDVAPWTLNEVMYGVVLTAIIWLIAAVLLSTYSSHAASITNSPVKAILVFLLSALVEGAFVVAPLVIAWRAARAREGASRWRVALRGLGFRRFNVPKSIIAIIGFFLLIYLVNFIYQLLITTFHLPIQTNDQYILERGRLDPLTTYATLLAGVLTAPLCEEIFFRGMLLGGLRRSMPDAPAVIISAFVFALAHFDIGSFAVLLVIGLILGYLRCRTRSIWPSIGLHLLNNGYSSLLIVLALNNFIKV
ncbi:type II CAAX endopeptidase family protein [Ktedonospora formicarum]|uniref:CAAX prenyl protease 2/Lysostaphin resistance protein A-like domain-containing protein n=1 Tax=Ktedonospora formicarum TaxID=2778364 RepID=A0A8J3I111_9CHLR|nr:type II CAAX endopeptidase family protein [Ktedonospora formicarum]GHO45616.1 hypothetical protein KSX_37790 [Ktedonospora formicarum]